MYCGPMITLIFGTKYGDSIGLLQIFAFAIPFAFNVSGNIISSLNKQIINSRIDMTASVVSITSSLILIKYFKAEGAVLSIVIVSAISYILSNGYLIKNRYVNYTKTARIRFTLLIISLVCYAIKISLEGYHMHVMSMTVVTVIYFALVWIVVVDKEDVDLIKKIIK
jgi:O-antigen/teichoic acid export membrane protein